MNNEETRYQYAHVSVEHVIENPNEYIIPECQPACKALWDKNIETFMVSNYDDDYLYVLLLSLSDENKAVVHNLMKNDARYYYDGFRDTYGIRVRGISYNYMVELESLTRPFEIQDTLRFQDAKEFLDEYKTTDGKLIINDEGYVERLENPELENATLEDALAATGKQDLYVPEEGKIYKTKMHLEWHKKYQQHVQDYIEEIISSITSRNDNISADAENLRDAFLTAEKEYVAQLLKEYEMRELISFCNENSSDTLFQAAKEIVENVENGLIPEEKMESVEKKLIVLLAAIKDKVLIKELTLTPDYDNFSRGRSL